MYFWELSSYWTVTETYDTLKIYMDILQADPGAAIRAWFRRRDFAGEYYL